MFERLVDCRIICFLSVILGKNAHIVKDLIYYDKKSEEFVFITINNKEVRLKKGTSFFIRDNKRNIGELIMNENGKKKVMFGFSADSEEAIKREIAKYQA